MYFLDMNILYYKTSYHSIVKETKLLGCVTACWNEGM